MSPNSRRQLTAFLDPATHESAEAYVERAGTTLSAVTEVLWRHVDDLVRTHPQLLREARRVDAERRRRK